jgi:RNA polymerase sigma factor (TIGR02999 family)
MTEITHLLLQLTEGRREVLDQLMPVVYQELKSVAQAQLRRERPGHTLNTTALVHEAYLKLVNVEKVQWRDRAHFFAMAARMMRRILIDYARTRNRDKRGGGAVAVTLDESLELSGEQADDLVELDEALTRLESISQRQARVVEYRCFAGLSVEETAEVLDTSPATVKRDWAFARAWLNRELDRSDRHDPPDAQS